MLRRNPNISLVFVKRQANLVSHCLANESRNYTSPFYYKYAPNFIVNLLVADSA